MATIIRRSPDIGDARLPRAPFAEPGPRPSIRLSALSVQGGDGLAVSQIGDAEYGYSMGQPSDGNPVTYRVPASGVPAFEYDSDTTTIKPGLHRPNSGGALIRTHLAVVRIKRLPNAAQGAGEHSEARLLSSYYSAPAEGLYMLSTTHATYPGALILRGAPGNVVFGPPLPADNSLHFVAGVLDGTTGRLHVDALQLTGTTGTITGPHFNTGNSKAGAAFEIVEAAQYTNALTVAQIEEKRAHYRALYQF